MIDIAVEKLITFAEAARLRPPTRAGRQTHPATLHRWRQRGCRGIMLEAIRVGSTWYTSVEAMQRFVDRLTVDANPDAVMEPPHRPSGDAKSADAVLSRLGF